VIGPWIASRLGLDEVIDGWFDAPVVGGPSWARAFSAATLFAMALAGVTGLGLGAVYSPGQAGAWASVFFSEFVLSGGWLVRSLHMMSAEASIVLGATTLLLWVVEGRYRGRRDLAFWCQALVAALAFVFCITGNPLRWDNRGYFGFSTEANIAAEVPLVGRYVRALLVGGSSLGNWTLARLYSLHTMLLPLAAAAIVAIWHRTGRRHAADASVSGPTYAESQLPRDLLACAATFVGILVLGYLERAPLEAPADPLGSYNARPEWYFQSLYVIRNAVPPKLQGLIASSLPGVLAAGLVALPLLDRDPQATLKKRAPFLAVGLLTYLGAVGLTLVGVISDRNNPDLKHAHISQSHFDQRAVQIAKVNGIPPAGALAMMREDPVLHAEELFHDKCASCHKLGDQAPADGKLAAPRLDGWGSEAWVMAVLEDPDAPDLFGNTPYKGKMPSYTKPPADPQAAKDFKPMPAEQRQAIARFLAGEAKGAPKGHDPDGEKLVKQRCTSCHLYQGETDDPQNLAPELSGWGNLAWTRAQIANPGTNATYRPASLAASLEGHMPRYDQDMPAHDVDLLTRFLLHRAARSKR
jgi:ubiquinol-cytochrome c reductase cytochrome b subunit